MAKQLKVYGWSGFRTELRAVSPQTQSREILAATSVAEVLRTAGITRGEYAHAGCETGNPAEVAAAVANPGVVLFAPLDRRGVFFRKDEDGTLIEVTPDPNLMRAYVLEGRERMDRLIDGEAAELSALRERGFVTGVR